MRFRNTIILAVLVAAFGAYLYFVERPAIEQEAEEKKLVILDTDQVSKIQLDSPKGKIELTKSDDTWKVTAPVTADADKLTVDNLLRAIRDAELKRTVEEKPEDLAKFGLAEPETKVLLTLNDGKTVKLEFGKKTPIGFSAYVRRNDEPAVLLTTETLRTGMQKELSDVRDKTILSFNDADVKAITISGVEAEPTVLRKEGNSWSITSPVERKADDAQVRSLLSSLRSLRASGFVDDAGSPPGEQYGLTPPRVTVELVLGPDETKKTLLVGGATPEPSERQIYVKTDPGETVYRVGSYVFSTVSKTAADLRDKTVLAFDKDAARSVVVERADGAGFVLEKKDDKWTVADAGDVKVKEFIASRFVDDVRELKGTDIASETGPEPSFGLDQPLLKITVRGADGDLGVLRVSSVGEGADKKVYATADGSETVYLLQDYTLQRVDKRRADFLDAPTPTPTASPTTAPSATASDAADTAPSPSPAS